MTKGSKAIISICLVFSLILMGMGVYLIFMPETGSQGQVQQGDVNNNNVQNPNVQQNAVNNQIQQNPNANANNRVQTPADNANQAQTPAASPEGDPSSWNTQQIIDKLTLAMNTTKSSTGSCTAHHKEGITVEITDCPGGNTVKNLITPIVDKFTQPTEEDITFTNGAGTNSKGESITFNSIPPVDKNFSLPAAGAASASASSDGTNTVINVTLVEEKTTLDSPVPQYTSNVIGYLNLNNLDLGSVKVTACDFTYTGSSVTATIDSNNRIVNIKYRLPMAVTGSGSMGFIKATVGFTGEQNEEWTFNWG
ncbi:MAG: hypothetical protein PUG93_02875 [Oscillospiraceae bacterium]|nr:hypothetical protein [Oscillospiraceae bacterium]MDY3937815.1 hypothetical protein [Oscillospiraceae bacterium]